MNEKRREFYEKLDVHLEEWSALISHLKDLTSEAKADVAGELSQLSMILELKRAEAWVRLKELKASGDERWEELEQALGRIQNEGKAVYHAAVAKFRAPVG
jgi:flagellar biosynthesis/type III secretory pathway protein FliH